MVVYSMQVKWSKPDRMYVATCPEFGDLSALGESYEDAVRELEVAIELAIATYKEDGKILPEPRMPETHSGQFRLRLPRSLHASLVNRADDEGVSLNTLVTSILAESQGYAVFGGTGNALGRVFWIYRSLLATFIAEQVQFDSTPSWSLLKKLLSESAESQSDSVDVKFSPVLKEE